GFADQGRRGGMDGERSAPPRRCREQTFGRYGCSLGLRRWRLVLPGGLVCSVGTGIASLAGGGVHVSGAVLALGRLPARPGMESPSLKFGARLSWAKLVPPSTV